MVIKQEAFFKRKYIQQTLKVFLVAIVYFLTAHLGLHLATINNNASPVWPATGVALFFVCFWGPWMGVGVFLGAFSANYFTNIPLPAVFMISVGNSLEALTGVLLYRRLSNANQRLGSHAKLINYVSVASFPTMISAGVGTMALIGAHVLSLDNFRTSLLTWWVGDTLGALVLFPIAVKIQKGEFTLRGFSRQEIWKLVGVQVFTIISCLFVFYSPMGPPYLFVIFLSLLFAIILLSPSWLYITALLIYTFAIFSTKNGVGPFSGGVLNENLLHLQLFLAGVGLTAIVLETLRKEGLLKSPRFALMFGWLITGVTFFSLYQKSIQNDSDHFTQQVATAERALQGSLREYTRFLKSGTAFITASNGMTRDDWRTFTSHLNFESQYPGIHGLGVIFAVANQKEAQTLTAQERENGYTQFNIHPVPNVPADLMVPHPPLKLIINYIEPMKTNFPAVGLEISSEKNRLETALMARDTGLPVITDQIHLIQDPNLRPSFVLFQPFYKKNKPILTLAQRREAFAGLVFSPIILENFVDSVLRSFGRQLDLKLYFGARLEPQNEVYSSDKRSDKNEYTKRSEMTFAGRPVVLLWKRGKEFKYTSSLVASWAAFFGALVSIFLSVLLSSLENLAARAQKIAEEKNRELSQRERLWRVLTETSPVGIYLSDEHGSCSYINSTLSKLLGHTLPEINDFGWYSLIHPDDHERVSQTWRKYKEAPEGKFCCTFRFIRGTLTLYVISEAVPFKNENGVIIGFLGTIQDVTELHTRQMALVTASRMSSLGEMAGGIAHEINNPLAIIAGKSQCLELLLEQLPENQEKVKGYLHGINSNVQRIAKIIKGLRTIARDVPHDPIRQIRVKDIVSDTLELCCARFNHHEITLSVPLIDDNIICMARPEQIVQVLLNLLNNAFDAVQELEEKWVRISILLAGDKLQIAVTDSGPGLLHELRDKIFIPFYTTKEVGKGTGLGLSISRSILEGNNGSLFVDENSRNTTFVVELNAGIDMDITP